MMTECQYVKLGGIRCPCCGSQEIDGSAIEVEAGICSQEVYCRSCQASWIDQYTLSGFELQSDPTEPHEEIVPAQEPKLKFWAVTGRIPGDDEDSLHVFEVATRDEATEAFENAMYAEETNPEEARNNVWHEYGGYVFINSIVSSESKIEEA